MKDYISKCTSPCFSFKVFVGGRGQISYLEGIRFEGRLALIFVFLSRGNLRVCMGPERNPEGE